MNRKCTWSLTAVAAGVVGVGAVLGISSANASPGERMSDHATPKTVSVADAMRSHANDPAHVSSPPRSNDQQPTGMNTRKTKVIKAVTRAFPHAKILKIVLHQDGTWIVALQLRNHRVGVVTVDTHFHVGTFKALTKRDADDVTQHPSTTVVVITTGMSHATWM